MKKFNRDFPLSPTPEPTPIRILDAGERAAKRGAMLKAKSEYKMDVAGIKQNAEDVAKHATKAMLKGAKKDYKAAKKEIRGYTDYEL